MSEKRIVVLGATGATGREVVTSALQRGHQVTAMVRQHGSFPPAIGLTEAHWPAVTDQPALVAALSGADAVISTLGGAPKGPTTVCADGMRATIAAMTATGVARLIAVSAHGVADSHDHSLYALAVWASVADRMRDKEAMEALIRRSPLEWTIVRPPALKQAAATGTYRTGERLPIHLWSAIGRADLAAFLVDEVEQPRYVRASPRIAR